MLKNKRDSVSAFYLVRWKNYSERLGHECRLHLLRREYAQKFMLTTIFNAFRRELHIAKHHRISVELLVVKAWRDRIAYKKQLMRQNLLSLKFMKRATRNTLHCCFLGLKMHKEVKKHQIVQHALTEDMDVILARYA